MFEERIILPAPVHISIVMEETENRISLKIEDFYENLNYINPEEITGYEDEVQAMSEVIEQCKEIRKEIRRLLTNFDDQLTEDKKSLYEQKMDQLLKASNNWSLYFNSSLTIIPMSLIVCLASTTLP